MSDELIIPVLDDARQLPGVNRGDIFFTALETIGISIEGQKIIDLGAGFGSISIAAARAGAAAVWAVDANPERTAAIASRAADAGVAVKALTANLLEPPKLPEFDLAFLVGVVEYAGLWDRSREVEDLQTRVLRTAWMSLRPGGALILGSKNRLWPRFVLRDVHTNQPLVNSLPRALVERWTSRRSSGGAYRHYIHSPRGWTRLLRGAGFSRVTVYVPYFSYQFPLVLTDRPRWRDFKELQHVQQPSGVDEVAVGAAAIAKASLMVGAAAVGLPLSQSVLIVAER